MKEKMKTSYIVLISVTIISIAIWLQSDFASGLLAFGIGCIPVAIVYGDDKNDIE